MPNRLITILDDDNQPIGSYELIEVQRRLQAGELRPNQMAHTDGMSQWSPLTAVIAHCLRLQPSRYAVPAPEPVAPAPVYAGFWLRFAAYLIDGLVVFVALDGLIAILMLAAAPHPFLAVISSQDPHAIDHPSLLVQLLIVPPFFIGPIFYFTLMESSVRQATLGKIALGIRVTNLKGQRLSFWHAFGRTAAKLVTNLTCLAFYAGYILAGFTPKKQALHDFIAKTLVVKK